MSNRLKKKISDRLKIFQTSEKENVRTWEKGKKLKSRCFKVLNETCVLYTQVSFKISPLLQYTVISFQYFK
jgi:hypothetical protein